MEMKDMDFNRPNSRYPLFVYRLNCVSSIIKRAFLVTYIFLLSIGLYRSSFSLVNISRQYRREWIGSIIYFIFLQQFIFHFRFSTLIFY